MVDVFEFLDGLVPDTDETRLVEKQELFRIVLTKRMRELRKQQGLTQVDVAQKLGVTQSWVSKMESCNNDHTSESLIAYFWAINCEIDLTIKAPQKQKTTKAFPLLSPEKLEQCAAAQAIIQQHGFWF